MRACSGCGPTQGIAPWPDDLAEPPTPTACRAANEPLALVLHPLRSCLLGLLPQPPPARSAPAAANIPTFPDFNQCLLKWRQVLMDSCKFVIFWKTNRPVVDNIAQGR